MWKKEGVYLNSRQKNIIQILEREGEVTIKALSERLDVSEMTIHRDADVLEKQRSLFKKRGALVHIENSDRDTTGDYSTEKRAIGLKAASLIEDGQSVIFDNSTTAMECSRFFDPTKKYTFYTTGMETAAVLSGYEKSILYCSGGYYFHVSRGFVGAQAEAFVRSVSADVCIIGASGVSIDGGITTPYPMHTTLQKAIIDAAKKKILLCDHSKFDKTAMEKICDLRDIDMIVTDGAILAETYEKYAKLIDIIKA